ncbi:MAG: hypothetical protein HY892_10365 [Deltaproteobacteria bacterium]|nr:hypothetical protein [Deltaproteobacteria bacterium]
MNGNQTATAAFSRSTCNLTVTPSGTGSGSVTGNGIDCTWNGSGSSGTCSVSLDYGTAVSLTATPGPRSGLSWLERRERFGCRLQRGGALRLQHHTGFRLGSAFHPEQCHPSASGYPPVRPFFHKAIEVGGGLTKPKADEKIGAALEAAPVPGLGRGLDFLNVKTALQPSRSPGKP